MGTPVKRLLLLALLLVAVIGERAVTGQPPNAFSASIEHAAIRYKTGQVDNTVSRLNRRLESGAVQLSFDRTSGYLESLLTALNIPVESQLLVFSETSVQAPLITPNNPRALFFNDNTAVGWVHGAETVEVATHDPRQGAVFYVLEQNPVERPQLKRQTSCLLCHLSWDTLAVPGFLTISTFPMSDDKNAYASGVFVDHTTPLDQRWGGWYVTGLSAPPRHFGNLPVVRPASELAKPAPPTPRLKSVESIVDVDGLPGRTSDVVAHLVLAHQTQMSNLLTRLGWEARLVEYGAASGEVPNLDRVSAAASDVVDYLLFIDEAPIPQKIEGSSGFAEKFSARGPRDHLGRSLRQLDLERRLMRYPCSYMIYSDVFDALPPLAKDMVYRRLWQVLSGEKSEHPYDKFSLAERREIVEILRDTKEGLPTYFQPVSR